MVATVGSMCRNVNQSVQNLWNNPDRLTQLVTKVAITAFVCLTVYAFVTGAAFAFKATVVIGLLGTLALKRAVEKRELTLEKVRHAAAESGEAFKSVAMNAERKVADAAKKVKDAALEPKAGKDADAANEANAERRRRHSSRRKEAEKTKPALPAEEVVIKEASRRRRHRSSRDVALRSLNRVRS